MSTIFIIVRKKNMSLPDFNINTTKNIFEIEKGIEHIVNKNIYWILLGGISHSVRFNYTHKDDIHLHLKRRSSRGNKTTKC